MLTYGSCFIYVNAHNISQYRQSASDGRIAFGVSSVAEISSIGFQLEMSPSLGPHETVSILMSNKLHENFPA
jgi:hypothetical protein